MHSEAKKDWRVGQLVILGESTTLLKESGTKSYSSIVGSQYVCIREATDGQRGILVKGLGKIQREHVMLVNGEPFCKDERVDLFMGKRYIGYPFPTADELKEVLNIVRPDMNIQQELIDNGMFFNPNGTFWVSDTKSQFYGLKRNLQYYDSSTDSLSTAKTPDERHHRITIAYF
jgi:hypothetical protein